MPSLNQTLRQRLTAQLATVRTARERLLDPADVESLHDVRVALRQLRSLLRGLRAIPGGDVLRPSLNALGESASASNAWRDREVRLGWLTQAASQADNAVFAAWRQQESAALLDGRQQLYRQMATLTTPLREIELATDLLLASPESILEHALRRTLRKTRRRYRAARRHWRHTPGDNHAAHAFRLLAKRLRYQAEAWGDLLCRRWTARAERAHRWQDKLGEQRDQQLLLAHVLAEHVPLPPAALAWLRRQAEH